MLKKKYQWLLKVLTKSNQHMKQKVKCCCSEPLAMLKVVYCWSVLVIMEEWLILRICMFDITWFQSCILISHGGTNSQVLQVFRTWSFVSRQLSFSWWFYRYFLPISHELVYIWIKHMNFSTDRVQNVHCTHNMYHFRVVHWKCCCIFYVRWCSGN